MPDSNGQGRSQKARVGSHSGGSGAGEYLAICTRWCMSWRINLHRSCFRCQRYLLHTWLPLKRNTYPGPQGQAGFHRGATGSAEYQSIQVRLRCGVHMGQWWGHPQCIAFGWETMVSHQVRLSTRGSWRVDHWAVRTWQGPAISNCDGKCAQGRGPDRASGISHTKRIKF